MKSLPVNYITQNTYVALCVPFSPNISSSIEYKMVNKTQDCSLLSREKQTGLSVYEIIESPEWGVNSMEKV